MLTKNSTKNKHLTIDERLEIQKGLDYGLTFKAIAKRIGKDQTTISKEVKKHLIIKQTNVKTTNIDGSLKEKQPCPKLLKAPFVCNACEYRRRHCKFDKQLYEAKTAQKDYKTLLVESREGIPLTKEEFYENDRIISEGLKKGQHLYHVLQTHSLTDNGGEFADVWAFENDSLGTKETSMFFCHPYRSCEKPHVEKNHTLFRDICPQGTSFDKFTQETVDLIFSHVNSVKRKNLNGKTPYEIFTFTYGVEIAETLGVSEIPATSVVQSPKLLKNLG